MSSNRFLEAGWVYSTRHFIDSKDNDTGSGEGGNCNCSTTVAPELEGVKSAIGYYTKTDENGVNSYHSESIELVQKTVDDMNTVIDLRYNDNNVAYSERFNGLDENIAELKSLLLHDYLSSHTDA